MPSINDLSLAQGLTAKVNEVCAGLDEGTASILGQVSEITAELLKWWFQADFRETLPVNFHPGQRQALLNVIYAHEVLGISTLQDLYQAAAPAVMLGSARDSEMIRAPKNAYPEILPQDGDRYWENLGPASPHGLANPQRQPRARQPALHQKLPRRRPWPHRL